MPKIKVKNPVVEMDGDEMTRIIWQKIREKLILPYLDIDLKYFDLGIEHRDATDDKVTFDSRRGDQEVRRRGEVRDDHAGRGASERVQPEADVSVAQRHDPEHPERHDLPRADRLLERAATRAALDQAGRRRPSRLRRPVQGQRRSSSPAPGTVKLTYTPADGGPPIEKEVFKAPGGGVTLAMYNLDDSIKGFARACFNYGLGRDYSVYLSTKNTILKIYDGRFKNLFQEVFDTEFKAKFDAKKLTYEHRLIDDMVAANLKWTGGYLWACKNYDGDVQSDTVAQGLRLARPHDERADVAGRQDRGGGGGARHGHAALPAAPAGQADLARTRSRRSTPGRAGSSIAARWTARPTW